MPIITHIAEYETEIATWRRHLHAHPETAFEELRTAKFVAKKLADWGIEVHEGIAKTGVVGVLHGANGPGERAIGLRADMDALNLEEAKTVSHRSTHPGKMHGCGHDGHTAMLLGAAKYLSATRNFDGTVICIFQPAEESAGGGRVMVEEGLFERFPMGSVWGMHNWPTVPAGKIAVHSTVVMAASDYFEIVVYGKGAHGALPHQSIDPVLVGAHIVVALQSLVSRNVDPLDAAVVSCTVFDGGKANNVIPDVARLGGGVRTFRPETRVLMEQRITRIATNVATAMGATVDISYDSGYPPTVNAEAESALAAKVAAEIVGPENVVLNPPPATTSEDFSYMLQEKPGCYLWLGSGDDAHRNYLHHPQYDFNDTILTTGASYWVKLVETVLPRPK